MDLPATGEPPHDDQAEQAILGAILQNQHHLPEVTSRIQPGDFYRPAHVLIYQTIVGMADLGHPVDPYTVTHQLAGQDLLHRVGGAPYLHTLVQAVPVAAAAGYYAAIVADHARHRQIEVIRAQIAQDTTGTHDPHLRLSRLRDQLDQLLAATDGQTHNPQQHQWAGRTHELDLFLNTDTPPYDWAIPGLLEHTDRVILTGEEGKGKSTLLRQIAVQAASGINPFTGEPIAPLRVLLVDLENSEDQTRRKIRQIRLAAADRYKPLPGLHLLCIPEGVDLLDPGTAQALHRHVQQVGPDLLITGPLYKMADADPTEEQPAKKVASWLDRLRVAARCALLIEAHSPHQQAARGQARPKRPYGASLWIRWPEFGIHLAEDGTLTHWRGQRDERAWPPRLRRGGLWPWTVEPEIAAALQAHNLDQPGGGPPPPLDPTILRQIAELDRLGIPTSYGKTKAREAITRASGWAGRNDTLQEAINHRKLRQEHQQVLAQQPPTNLQEPLYDDPDPGRPQ